MRTFSRLIIAASLVTIPFAVAACTSDDDDTATESTGGKATGGKPATGGEANEGGSGNDTASGGKGGVEEQGETITLSDELDDMTLEAKNEYILEGFVYVPSGVTLTIEPGTTIRGDKETLGTLIVERGGKIMAEGTEDEPIVFTAATEKPRPGDWGGVVILGKAPNAKGKDVNVEGTEADPRHEFGGTKDNDNSGVLKYVRIEYPGIDLGQGNEINGLSLGSVGSGTTISHVMVSQSLDDCYEWFGGTVNADHLICDGPGDDMFDTDDGYTGELSYLLGLHWAPQSSDPNGFEWDGTTDYEGPFTTVVDASHVTLCGSGNADYAMRLRRGIEGSISDLIGVGFSGGFSLTEGAEGAVTIEDSTLNVPELNPADEGLESWFTDDPSNNEDDVGFDAEECMQAGGPSDAVVESDMGAFSDGDWVHGGWTGW